MPNFTIKQIDIRDQFKSVDGIKVLFLTVTNQDDELHECTVIQSRENITGYTYTKTENKRDYHAHTVPKKRTLQASVKALVKAHPNCLYPEKNGYAPFSHLRSQDYRARDILKRAKRQWHVHELARWRDGHFAARVSCNRVAGVYGATQFVIRPTNIDKTSSERLRVSGLVDRMGRTDEVEVQSGAIAFLQALRFEEDWHHLGKLLAPLEYGYDSVAEAKHAFKKVLNHRFDPPVDVHDFGVKNKARQTGIDNTLTIEIVDEYAAHHNKQAYWVRANEAHFIMHSDIFDRERFGLKTTSIYSPFDTSPEKTARILVSRHLKEAMYPNQLTEAQGKAAWQDYIEADLLSRYKSDVYPCEALVTHIARSADKQTWAFRGDLIPRADDAPIPPCFRPMTHFAMVFEHGRAYPIHDHAREAPHTLHYIRANELIEVLAQCLRGKVDKTLFDKFVAHIRFELTLNDANDIEVEWAQATADFEIHTLMSGACVLPASFRAKIMALRIAQQRQKQQQWVDNGVDPVSRLEDFERKVQAAQTYPYQLVDAALRLGLVSPEDALTITTTERPESLEIKIDEKQIDAEGTHPPSASIEDGAIAAGAATTPSSPSTRQLVSPDEISAKDKTTSVKRGGRKRIHADDKARKRAWATKHRAEIKARQIADGQPPAKVGRKAIHADDNARARAYRFRKKYRSLAKDAGLILVNWQMDNPMEKAIHEGIEQLIPFYQNPDGSARVYATRNVSVEKVDSDMVDGQYPARVTHQALRFPMDWLGGNENNVYIKTWRMLPDDMLSMMQGSTIKQWHLCGHGLATDLYAIGLQLQSAGLQPYFHIALCQSANRQERTFFTQQYRQAFGKQAILR